MGHKMKQWAGRPPGKDTAFRDLPPWPAQFGAVTTAPGELLWLALFQRPCRPPPLRQPGGSDEAERPVRPHALSSRSFFPTSVTVIPNDRRASLSGVHGFLIRGVSSNNEISIRKHSPLSAVVELLGDFLWGLGPPGFRVCLPGRPLLLGTSRQGVPGSHLLLAVSLFTRMFRGQGGETRSPAFFSLVPRGQSSGESAPASQVTSLILLPAASPAHWSDRVVQAHRPSPALGLKATVSPTTPDSF